MSASVLIADDIAVVCEGVWSHGHPRIERLLQIVSDTIQVPDSEPDPDAYLAARMIEMLDAGQCTAVPSPGST